MVTRSSNRRGPCPRRDGTIWSATDIRHSPASSRAAIVCTLRGNTRKENPDADSPGGASGDPERGGKRDQVSAESTQPLHGPPPRGYRNAGLHAAAISECEATPAEETLQRFSQKKVLTIAAPSQPEPGAQDTISFALSQKSTRAARSGRIRTTSVSFCPLLRTFARGARQRQSPDLFQNRRQQSAGHRHLSQAASNRGAPLSSLSIGAPGESTNACAACADWGSCMNCSGRADIPTRTQFSASR